MLRSLKQTLGIIISALCKWFGVPMALLWKLKIENSEISMASLFRYLPEGRNGFLHRFQHLRLYRDEIEIQNWGEIPFCS